MACTCGARPWRCPQPPARNLSRREGSDPPAPRAPDVQQACCALLCLLRPHRVASRGRGADGALVPLPRVRPQVETIGDCYMVAAGLFDRTDESRRALGLLPTGPPRQLPKRESLKHHALNPDGKSDNSLVRGASALARFDPPKGRQDRARSCVALGARPSALTARATSQRRRARR